MYRVNIVADSIAPSGVRLTTWELTYPRFVHSEMMTHRMMSRNAASSRAIPNKKLREQVLHDPVIPLEWGKNQKGMQARTELTGWRRFAAKTLWLTSRYSEVFFSWALDKCGVHKQLSNRLLEPHMFITVLVTATEWDNFFKLRAHPDAQPEIRWVASTMQEMYAENIPVMLDVGEWHRPFITNEEQLQSLERLNDVSVARCARVSYNNHNGKLSTLEEDLALTKRLADSGHWSPFEHVARASSECIGSGNIKGWTQYREMKERK